jgi:DNA gyrase subunit B
MAETCVYSVDQIEVLEGLEPVRRRPGMYLGDVHDGSALHHLLWEVVANSIDEHLLGHATRLRVSVEDDLVEVEDDGRGLPVDEDPYRGQPLLQTILTTLHAGATWDGHVPHVHVAPGGFGVGLAVVNAVCRQFDVTVWRNGRTYQQRYAAGKPLGPLEKRPGSDKTGTRIRFRPDPRIFSSTQLDRRLVRERLEELALWNPELGIELMSESLHQPQGTVAWLGRLARDNDVELPSARFARRTLRSDVFVEVALAWADDLYDSDLRSFSGQNQTGAGGSHVQGFWQGLLEALAQRRPEAFRRPPRASRFRGVLSVGLLGVVHVGLRDPRYAGPCRDRLENAEAREAVRAELVESFGAFLASQPELEAMLFERIASG